MTLETVVYPLFQCTGNVKFFVFFYLKLTWNCMKASLYHLCFYQVPGIIFYESKPPCTTWGCRWAAYPGCTCTPAPSSPHCKLSTESDSQLKIIKPVGFWWSGLWNVVKAEDYNKIGFWWSISNTHHGNYHVSSILIA